MVTYVELDKILPNPWQTRGEPGLEHVQALAADIEKNGLLQTPVGRRDGDQVQLAFGHTRLAAFKVLAARGGTTENGSVSPWLRLPVDLLALSDEQMAQFAWSENERRRDLTPIERAKAIQKRMADFAWTQDQAAERLEISRTTVSNILRLLDLPENIQEALGSGELSERSAMALLPLFDVPEEVLNRQRYGWNSPEKIVEEALDGASSDAIRKKVNDYFERSFVSLHESSVKLDEVFQEDGDIYCGTCRGCDKRLASRNLCMNQPCFEAKVAVVRHRYLEKASLASGYDIIDEQKGGYPSALPYYPAELEKILKTKCANIRVAYDSSGNGKDDPRRVPGHPKAILVCDKRNDSCTCLKAFRNLAAQERERMAAPVVPDEVKATIDEGSDIEELEDSAPAKQPSGNGGAPTPAELEAIMRQARRDKRYATEKAPEIRRMVAELLERELANDAPGAFYVLVNGYVSFTREMPSLDQIYALAGVNMAGKFMPSNYESVEQVLARVNGRLQAMGLPEVSLEKTLGEVFEEAEQ